MKRKVKSEEYAYAFNLDKYIMEVTYPKNVLRDTITRIKAVALSLEDLGSGGGDIGVDICMEAEIIEWSLKDLKKELERKSKFPVYIKTGERID